ncbi:NAD-dependent succinate-semialdehyde dehydrogenase [Pseudomonas palleroniana]|uniref:NAD-dependent succinate-semialdehyde dehydrogenase n=1 Tax=Pseudomonas palleroniana TaxID=191390 RepID=UPI001E40EF61|nr:NAD-dependent succinate-semialdehyde dehydrogenase [Pseudomonas palleroniana]
MRSLKQPFQPSEIAPCSSSTTLPPQKKSVASPRTTDEVKAALDRVCAAFPAWSARLASERSDILRRWHDSVKADKEAFAELLCRENGKCLSEARGEIDYGLGFIEWYAEEAKRVYGDTLPTHDRNAHVVVTKEAVGPVAAITPWNFPFMMITRKVATALAAGCTMVIKPAEDTPLTALKLLEYARKAGIPEGVLEVVVGDPKAIGLILTGDPRIRKISFTGSTAVGKLLAAQCAATVKKMTLELGGNAPFIVFEDANLDEAVKGLVSAKLRNCGQVCISPNRIFVQSSILQAFLQRVQAAVADIEVDQGLREGFVVGPLVNQAGFDKVVRLVEQAKAAGADVLMGGKPHAKGGLFYEPTILTGLQDDSPLATEEIFGPVFAIYPFEDEEEAIRRANQTEFGLVAYAYTRALGRSLRLSSGLEAGMVILNSGSVGTASVPFGGIKQSGYGREGSYYGIEEYVHVKYVLMAGAHF